MHKGVSRFVLPTYSPLGVVISALLHCWVFGFTMFQRSCGCQKVTEIGCPCQPAAVTHVFYWNSACQIRFAEQSYCLPLSCLGMPPVCLCCLSIDSIYVICLLFYYFKQSLVTHEYVITALCISFDCHYLQKEQCFKNVFTHQNSVSDSLRPVSCCVKFAYLCFHYKFYLMTLTESHDICHLYCVFVLVIFIVFILPFVNYISKSALNSQ